MSDSRRQFASRIIRLTRVAKGLRQQDVADALGVSRARISQIEHGCKGFGRATLIRFADALDSADVRDLAADWGSK